MDWQMIVSGIQEHGIRNAAQTTVAPTGTIATVAGCEGYGCEPVFALAYIRHVNDNGRDLQLTYASPLFDLALRKAGLDDDARSNLIDAVMREAKLKGANLSGADLFGADLTGADLSGADLSESRLSRAILTDAKLDGANLKGALMPDGSTHE